MVKLLLSSRAFSTVAVTDAFFTLVAPVAKNSARIVIIVNSVSTGKNHPQMVALQQTVQQLGYAHVQLLDVLTDDLAALNTATVIILNGGYEFLLLKNLRETHVLERLRTLALAGKPIYGISAGAILLGPDLDLYAYLYPEDNTEQLASTTAINATTIRIYPHYDVHCEVKPQLPQLITDWEHKTGVTVKRLINNQGLLVHGSQIQMIDSDS
ncbi:Type 1 glutamine amidotransferase-like domain-containing protein [Lactiplantibacillus plantarum]|uniref:Dipeptidase E n=1 Tax=Lactiplantibacillus plantarum subsp. plantarum TaxID=337330 RepID=A0A2S3U840_LACPN|nr:Type 1 glutamine amidotransferase-like domain-containing protein [Lactiplantibacillus plantarum]MBY8573908.1 Type 1 glutamine amidotransferase-like domain-containing protein [Lactiplantibacillus plantarum]POD87074.1 Dipeptidase E [Lactiplantibacillus plantarum subsp. plantarum]